jgi:hypothetical protein
MSNEVQWATIEHSGSRRKGAGKHTILACYRSRGAGGMNDVLSVSPLYDLRDADLNGSVTWLEAGWSAGTAVVDPVKVFGIINSLGGASFMLEAARELKDYELQQLALRGVLEGAYNVRHEMLAAVAAQSFVVGNVNVSLDLLNLGLAEVSRFGFATMFIVKKIAETAVMKSVLPLIK